MTTIDPTHKPATAAEPYVEPWAWSPVVGGWAEHTEHGRVLIIARDEHDDAFPWVVMLNQPQGNILPRFWCSTDTLSPPVPLVWDTADKVPAHVVVRDREQRPFAGAELHVGYDYRGPFTEVLPEAGAL